MTDKITLNTLASIQNDPTAVALINANSAAIVAGIDNTLSRDGTAPNQMGASLDMNSFQILNLPTPTSANSPIRVADANTLNGGGTITVPPTGQIQGTATNDAALSGRVGEYVSSTVTTGSAVSLTNVTTKNITSISLTAGDWEVWANCYLKPANTTQVSGAFPCISTVDGTTLNQTAGQFSNLPNFTSNGQDAIQQVVGPFRLSLSTTTTVFLNIFAGFSTSTLSAWGILQARRVR